jgi:hypothetical protein
VSNWGMKDSLGAPTRRSSGWRKSLLKALLSVGMAAYLPAPWMRWSPLSLLLWGLIGDPASIQEAVASAALGGTLLVTYAAAIYCVLKGLEAGGAAMLEWSRRKSARSRQR